MFDLNKELASMTAEMLKPYQIESASRFKEAVDLMKGFIPTRGFHKDCDVLDEETMAQIVNEAMLNQIEEDRNYGMRAGQMITSLGSSTLMGIFEKPCDKKVVADQHAAPSLS